MYHLRKDVRACGLRAASDDFWRYYRQSSVLQNGAGAALRSSFVLIRLLFTMKQKNYSGVFALLLLGLYMVCPRAVPFISVSFVFLRTVSERILFLTGPCFFINHTLRDITPVYANIVS